MLRSKGSYLKTTTTGDSDFVTTIRPFQIIKAENTIMARFNPWNRSWRLFFQSFFSSITWDFTMSISVVWSTHDKYSPSRSFRVQTEPCDRLVKSITNDST